MCIPFRELLHLGNGISRQINLKSVLSILKPIRVGQSRCPNFWRTTCRCFTTSFQTYSQVLKSHLTFGEGDWSYKKINVWDLNSGFRLWEKSIYKSTTVFSNNLFHSKKNTDVFRSSRLGTLGFMGWFLFVKVCLGWWHFLAAKIE